MEHGQIQTIVPILLSIRNPGSLHMHLNKHNVALQEMFFEIFTKLGIVDKNYLLYSNKFVVWFFGFFERPIFKLIMYEINSHTRYFEHVKPFYYTHFQGLLMIEILLDLNKVLFSTFKTIPK